MVCVALYSARIREFERLYSGLCGAVIERLPPLPSPFFFLPLFHQCDECLEWGLMAGLQRFANHGAVLYLGAGWPQWKPLGIPGTHLPLKRGSWSKQNFMIVD